MKSWYAFSVINYIFCASPERLLHSTHMPCTCTGLLMRGELLHVIFLHYLRLNDNIKYCVSRCSFMAATNFTREKINRNHNLLLLPAVIFGRIWLWKSLGWLQRNHVYVCIWLTLQKRLIECLQWVVKMVMDESKMVACSMPSLLQQNFNLHVYKLPTMLQPTSSRLIRKHFTLCYAVNLIFRRFIIGKFTCMQ